MLVPKGSLLLSCYALISLFLPLPAGVNPHFYSFSVSQTSVWMEFIKPISCSLHYFGDRETTVWCSY